MSGSNSSLNRRSFLQRTAGALLAAGLPVTRGLRPFAPYDDIPVATQLYCVRKEMAEDLPGTIAALARMGYQGVEFADYFGRSAAELRRHLDDNGLRCCGTHIYLEDMLGDRLEETVAFNKTLGNEYLIVRWLGDERRTSRDVFMKTVDQFNEVAAALKPHGMRVGYHNHDYIFKTFDGDYLWNILADHTGPEVVLQMDTGNAAHVDGVDVLALIHRNAGRTATMHVKPFSKANPDAFIGEDELDWPAIFTASEEVGGIEWYIIEYEQDAFPPLEALEANLARFKQLRA